MPSRPSTLPTWATDVSAVIADPGSTKQATGWLSPEKPSDGNFNWWMNLVGQWITYLGQVTAPTYVNCTTGTSYTANAFELVTLSLATPAPFTLNLPATPSAGDEVYFKDIVGNLARYPLTIVPASGTIEGQSSLLVTLARVELTIYYNGTQWVLI